MLVSTWLSRDKLASLTGFHAARGTEDGECCVASGSLKGRLVYGHSRDDRGWTEYGFLPLRKEDVFRPRLAYLDGYPDVAAPVNGCDPFR